MVRGKCEGGAKEGAKRLRSFICTLKGNWCEGGAKGVQREAAAKLVKGDAKGN